MPNSKAPSITGTASTSRASRIGGVQLTPSHSTASSVSGGGAVIYTPSTASDATGTPAASIVSAIPTTSTSLNAVFARLGIDDQRKSLRSLQNTVLSEALGCIQKEVPSLIVTSTSDELWAAFCHLNIENRKKSLESVRKFALRKAFGEGNDEGSTKAIPYSAAIAPSEATTNTLASFFKKLSVEDQEEALAAVQEKDTSQERIRRDDNGRDLNAPGGGEEDTREDTLIDSKPDLAEWQELCRACGVEVEDIPGSITKCKEILRTKNVALSDLSEAIEQGTVAQTFPSLNQLRKHVTSHNKVANKAATKENRFLKKMLRELFRYRGARATGGE